MKAFFLAATALGMIAAASAQNRFQQEAYLMNPEGIERVYIADANKTEFLFFETEVAVDPKTMRIASPGAIWLVEPERFSEAKELYEGRDYQGALAAFNEVREKYKKLITLRGNHSSHAAFYAMECLRKLGRFAELEKAFESFTPTDRDSLMREHEVRQLDHYLLWDAVEKKQWERLEGLARDRLAEKMPGYQKVQVAYALGIALENLGRTWDAIDAYNLALVADTGASEDIVPKAALRALGLYLADPGVKEAMAEVGTEAEEKNSEGALRMVEGGALANLYELTLGNGAKLPAEMKPLLKFAPEPKGPVAETPTTEGADKGGGAKKAPAPKASGGRGATKPPAKRK